MIDLQTAQAAVADAETDLRALEARAADIAKLREAGAVEKDQAASAVAAAIVDGLPEKRKEAAITADVKAELTLRALAMAGDEIQTRLDRARDHLAQARRDLAVAQERAEYGASAVALETFTTTLLAALGQLVDDVHPRHRADIEDVVRRATSGRLEARVVQSVLAEWINHMRRRAGIVKGEVQVSQAGAPHPDDTGVIALRDLRFMNADGTERYLPAGYIGNAPAEVVRRAAAAGAAQQLEPRKGFVSIEIVRDHSYDLEPGTIQVFTAGLRLSVSEELARRLMSAGAARRTPGLHADDVAWWQKSHDRPRVDAVRHSANAGFVPPVDLGRLGPFEDLEQEAA